MMRIYTSILFSFILFLPHTSDAQKVTGRLVDQYGSALIISRMELYVNSQIYYSYSLWDGSFTFNNVTYVGSSQLPKGYSVSNNYPNPFNPKTRINITLPSEGRVGIQIYNTLGQKAKEDVIQLLNAGTNYIDLELNGLSNGIYIAKINLDDKYSVTKKLMLLYGSQHLKSAENYSISSLYKSSIDINSVSEVKLDSLAVINGMNQRTVFNNLPPLTGNSLDLGNLTITIPPPAQPRLSSPENGSTNVDYFSSNLSWIGQKDALKYELQVSTDSSFANLIYDKEFGMWTSLPINISLQRLNTYYWRVRAINNYGISALSPVWNFKTTAIAVISFFTNNFYFPESITMDASANIFASLENAVGSSNGIQYFNVSTGKFDLFLDPSKAPFSWSGMKFTSDGTLYLTGAQSRIATVPPAGGSLASFVVFPVEEGIHTLNDLDFDINKNIWTGGYIATNRFYSIDSKKNITKFPFTGIVSSIRVYDGYLYLAALRDSTYKIYRYRINSASSIGTEELYFDFGKYYGQSIINTITFSSDGHLYLGLNNNPGIVLVYPKASKFENLSIYSSQSGVSYSSFFWDKENSIYAIQNKPDQMKCGIVKIRTEMFSAPYYGLK